MKRAGILILTLVLITLLIPKCVVASAWLTDYTYRKSITLSRASGAVTNYQMRLLLGESSGASGEDVNCGGLCASDFDDIRFTNSDGTTLLDYWIESISGTTPNQLATIWIEFDSIGTGATTFYLYYGNASATAASNGANTFILYEDFEWGNDGDDITTSGGGVTWVKNVYGASTAKIDTGQKYQSSRSVELAGDGTAGGAYIETALTASDNISIRLRVRKNGACDFRALNGNGSKLAVYRLSNLEDIFIYNGTAYVDTGANCTVDVWESHELNHFVWSTPTVDASLNDSKIADDFSINYSLSAVGNKLRIQNYSGAGSSWIDEIIVRNWRVVEPAWGSWGNLEQQIDFGVVRPNSTYYAKGSAPANPVTDDNCTFLVKNDGSATVKVQMRVTDFTGGNTWNVVSTSPSGDEIKLTAYYTGLNPANGLVLSNTDQDFYASLAASETIKWDFKIETGGSGVTFSDSSQKNGTITLSAVAP